MARALTVCAAGALVALCGGCKKSDASSTSGAASAEAAIAPAASAAGAAAPLAGLDECLVGKWKAEKVSLKLDQVSAEGGANVSLDIASSGASSIDFTRMSEVHAKANAGFSFDFKYSGKASGMLKTPTRGSVVSEGTNLADLRVSAPASLPGAAAVPVC